MLVGELHVEHQEGQAVGAIADMEVLQFTVDHQRRPAHPSHAPAEAVGLAAAAGGDTIGDDVDDQGHTRAQGAHGPAHLGVRILPEDEVDAEADAGADRQRPDQPRQE